MATGVLCMSACTWGGDTDEPLAEVARKTHAARTASVTFRMTFPRGLASYRGVGFVSFADGRSRSRLTGFDLTNIVDGRTMYTRYGSFREWVRIPDLPREALLDQGEPVAWMDGLDDAEDVHAISTDRFRARTARVAFELWVDGRGRARRIRFRDHAGATIDLRFVAFSRPVVIENPSSGVVSLDEFNARRDRELRERCEDPAPGDLALCSLFPREDS